MRRLPPAFAGAVMVTVGLIMSAVTADTGGRMTTVAVSAEGTFSLSIIEPTVYEGGVAEVTIYRNSSSGAATVRLFTASGTAGAADFSARPNTSASDVLFLDGEITKTVEIPIIADGV